MALQLRQICLVAEQLAPVIDNFTNILGIRACHVDPGVEFFGLENTLMTVGHNFLEVVAPIQEGTAAGRYLERRQGDGGYMVITQASDRDSQQTIRQRALDMGVRIAHESERGDWGLCQLHPRDMVAAFLEVEWDSDNDFNGKWMPAGGNGWQETVSRDVTVDYLGAELQAEDPLALADHWAKVIGVDVERGDNGYTVALDNAVLRFVALQDDRGPGLTGLDIKVADRKHVLAAAKSRGCYVNDSRVDICGTRFYLSD